MLLQETCESLCDTPLYYFNRETQAWQRYPVDCRLAVYDRFISDRAFGQKKRVIHAPAGSHLDSHYYRVGTPLQGPIYMLESENQDSDSLGPYYSTYMARQLSFEVEQLRKVVTGQLASGIDKVELQVQPGRHWADVEAYSTSKSEELPVQFTQMQLFTPKFFDCPKDSFVRVLGFTDTKYYKIDDRLQVLDTCVYRVSEAHV